MASKEWTQEQRERAAEQLKSKIDSMTERDQILEMWNGENFYSPAIDLQCELNEARELLEAYSEVGITIRDEQVTEWISRNK